MSESTSAAGVGSASATGSATPSDGTPAAVASAASVPQAVSCRNSRRDVIGLPSGLDPFPLPEHERDVAIHGHTLPGPTVLAQSHLDVHGTGEVPQPEVRTQVVLREIAAAGAHLADL